MTAMPDHPTPGGLQPADPAAALRQLIMGFRSTQLVRTAAELGLADHFTNGPKTAAELAPLLGADPAALHRLMRALASLGLLSEIGGGTYGATALSDCLRTEVVGSLRGMARVYGADWLWRAYAQLPWSIATGKAGFDAAHGQPLFAFLNDHADASAVFHEAMAAFSGQEAAAILAAYDFASAGCVVDLGGGDGTLLALIATAHADMSGILFDQALAAQVAHRTLATAGVADRITVCSGDFFESVPQGGDLYLLKSVIHDWDDANAVRSLETCRRAMADSARLLVIERVVPEGPEPAEAKLFDINMLVMTGGCERTEAEHVALLAKAGFTHARTITTASPLSLIEAIPVV
jgi:hypothetical protein